jgi:hypothetical protein
MRLDRVEIKLTLSGDRSKSAVQTLNLPSVAEPWQIHFCEDVPWGVDVATPLFAAGVVLRARHRPGKKDDSTVKLRPCRRSQLTDDWLEADEGDGWDVKVEADWAATRRVLAVSHTADRPIDVVPEAGRGQRPATSLFTDRQEDFLRDCSPIRVNLRTLTVLPPITATRWDTVKGAPEDLGVRAERWAVDDLDFLELSAVAELDDAEARQSALSDYVASLGLDVDQDAESKTGRVIEHLVRRVLDSG